MYPPKYLCLTLLFAACTTLSNASNTAGCSSTCGVFASILGGGKVIFPSTGNSTGVYYAAQEQQLTPACVLVPTSIDDVSFIVKKLSFVNGHGQHACSWAVEGGGHTPNPGWANINGGITLSLSGLADISLNNDKSIVSIEGGARWKSVYDKLTPLGLSVAGGRNNGVGVGGLTTGGGISFFTPLVGFTCDNVVNYLVVLGDGSLVSANAVTNRALWTALKGGSSNFGVVVQFDMTTFPVSDYLGGAITSPFTTLEAQVDALVNITNAEVFDPYTSIIWTVDYVPGFGLIIFNALGYTSSNVSLAEPPAPIAAFSSIQPQLESTLRISNVSDFVTENTGAASPYNGLRNSFTTTTFKPTSKFINEIVTLFNSTIVTSMPANSSIESAAISFEPIPTAITSKGSSTNSLGLGAKDGNLMLIQVSISWTSTADDTWVNESSQKLIDQIDSAAKLSGLFNEWKYLNYAASFQPVIQGYGSENVASLLRTSQEYDPQQVFQKDVPGGFKLC